ncbi:MAG: lysophospholipid acyltransferase family protein, partial [Planctomycetales bacterium]
HAPLVRALLERRSVVVVAAHFGNFELGGYLLGLLGFPTHTVARKLDNPYLHDFINRFRSKTGQYMIPKIGGYEQICTVLEQNGVMTFVADQYAGIEGCKVEFFGRPVSAHKAIALFALRHEAVIAVGSLRRLNAPMRYEMRVDAIVDAKNLDPRIAGSREMTQWFTSEMEKFIRLAPEQYWWLHTRWRVPPVWGRPRRRPRRRANAQAAAKPSAPRTNQPETD